MKTQNINDLENWRIKFEIFNPIVLILMGLLLVILGIVSQTVNNDFEYLLKRYDDECSSQTICSIIFNIPTNLKPPVFISYEISEFFQNIDTYFESVSLEQLEGKSSPDTSNCHPYLTNKQMRKTLSVSGKVLNENDIAIPCGALAFSYFNDTYSINGYTISNKGIAWESDVEYFHNINQDNQWIDMTDERFINWIRYSGLSRTRKLWGRIDTEVKSGNLTVQIQNNYDDKFFQVNKYLVIHNDGQYSDPILVVTLPCLISGVIFIIIGIISAINLKNRRVFHRKYKLQ